MCLYGLVGHAAVKECFHDDTVALRVKREQIVNKPAIRYPKQVRPVAAGAQEECCSSKEALSLHLNDDSRHFRISNRLIRMLKLERRNSRRSSGSKSSVRP